MTDTYLDKKDKLRDKILELRKKLKEMEMQFGGKNRSGNIFINH